LGAGPAEPVDESHNVRIEQLPTLIDDESAVAPEPVVDSPLGRDVIPQDLLTWGWTAAHRVPEDAANPVVGLSPRSPESPRLTQVSPEADSHVGLSPLRLSPPGPHDGEHGPIGSRPASLAHRRAVSGVSGKPEIGRWHRRRRHHTSREAMAVVQVQLDGGQPMTAAITCDAADDLGLAARTKVTLLVNLTDR
jgi:hypothetical protein